MQKVSYGAPLKTAWHRTVAWLFAPWDLAKWLAIAFAAWVARLDEGGWGVLPALRIGGRVFQAPWLRTGTPGPRAFLLASAGATVLLGAFALGLFVMWLASRARFIFWDNAVRGRAEWSSPWVRLRALGDSLFLWRLGFLVVAAGLGVCAALLALAVALPFATRPGLRPLSLLGVLVGGSLSFSILVGVAYVQLFLEDFIVPLMHKLNGGATRAWSHFLVLLRAHFLTFLIYGLVRFALAAAALLLVVLAFVGLCFVCCAGLLLLVPYVGTALLLPLLAVFRFYGPAFLAQFGPAYDCFGAEPSGGGLTKTHRFPG